MAKLNSAAFSPDDVDDARRGHPDFDLRGYASNRGLEFLDHGTAAGFRAALPGEEELQSSVLRGTLPGGEYGVIAHEGLEVPYSTDSPDWGGSFYGERVRLKGSWKPGDSPSGVARVPCTVAAVRVPETAGTHPYMRIDTRRSSPPFSFTNRESLDDLIAANGWSLWCEPRAEPETVRRLVADPVAGLLGDHDQDGLFQLVVWWATLVVRRNGYLRSPDGLDELGRAAGVVSERLREVCRSLADPQPFEAELPPPPLDQDRELPAGFHPGEVWRKWALETAERQGLALENPFAYHRAFPSLPVPGTAYVVLRGEIPDLGPARLVVHRERDAVRPAVVMAARPGAEPTPPGGLPFREQAARLEIADGLLAVWSITSWTGHAMLDHFDEFCAAAASVIDESGLR